MIVYVWDWGQTHLAVEQVERWADDVSIQGPALCGRRPHCSRWLCRWFTLDDDDLCKSCARAQARGAPGLELVTEEVNDGV